MAGSSSTTKIRRVAGHEVVATANGREGLEIARAAELDLLILDVMLPEVTGFDILAEVRQGRPTLPVIMVTARGAEADRVFGLEHGADDYVVKPFSARELLARVDAVLRRSAERPLDVTETQVRGRTLDVERREVRLRNGDRRALSEREVDILRYLASNTGRAVSRDEMLQRLWGLDPKSVQTRTLDMHIARLREKLGGGGGDDVIVTVRGKGYMLAQPEAG